MKIVNLAHSILLLQHCLSDAQATNSSLAVESGDDLADFGQTVPILGQDFKDGLAIDLFSPKNRTFIVTQNQSPLSGRFVTGSTGEPFTALSNYSWIIKVNDSAHDLIAKVELPYDPTQVQNAGFAVANTYVGVLAQDGKSWTVDESRRNVHVSENKTRIIKLTSLDGEYVLLGRKTLDTANIFVQYGFGATRTVNLTGGNGIQEAEFIDGLRMSVMAEKEMRVNIDLKNGIKSGDLPPSTNSINPFTWAVNTSDPAQALQSGFLSFPVNTLTRSSKKDNKQPETGKLSVARRDLNASSSTFTPFSESSQRLVCKAQCLLQVKDLKSLDGEYIVLVSKNP
ncbi:hypothetical protein FB567DRAFT_547289 [Paraphoma chrysanthemicola]|uniref:Uncharacterized protein n=1 Tax=Paraphoma chrysanthemicola TaxID=798071 RepID=A0A8K0R7X6_9PLEO|nr:hypothetical protein FB567DRAFT_547289 [Paraphoma chrysanthemicola]